MIMAIGAVVVIAGVMAISLSLSTKSVKRTTDIYLYEQANIHLKSAAEFALLTIANTGACTANPIINTSPDGIFTLNVSVLYSYDTTSQCGGNLDFAPVTTPEQNGSVLMDITVSTNAGTEPIRVFKRTIQKL